MSPLTMRPSPPAVYSRFDKLILIRAIMLSGHPLTRRQIGAGLHVLDTFVNLAGAIVAVDARSFSQKSPPDPRDAAAALVQFESGATGLPPMFWRLHVFGSKGWAEARDETTLTVAPIGEKPDMQIFPQVDLLAVLLEAFAESVETGIPFPVSTTEMLDVAGAFEAVVRSMTEGGSVTVRRT